MPLPIRAIFCLCLMLIRFSLRLRQLLLLMIYACCQSFFCFAAADAAMPRLRQRFFYYMLMPPKMLLPLMLSRAMRCRRRQDIRRLMIYER